MHTNMHTIHAWYLKFVAAIVGGSAAVEMEVLLLRELYE